MIIFVSVGLALLGTVMLRRLVGRLPISLPLVCVCAGFAIFALPTGMPEIAPVGNQQHGTAIEYLQRITPRKARSAWSKRNTEHADRLIKEGRMQAPGLAQIEAAKADGRWENAYAPASEMEIPDDFISAVKKEPKAKTTFEKLNKTNRYAIAYGLTTAKKPETRERRFEKFLGMLARGEKPDFGFRKK